MQTKIIFYFCVCFLSLFLNLFQQVDPFAAAYSAGLLANPSIPRYGTVIPNRIFVGGIDFKVGLRLMHAVLFLFGCVFSL